MGGRSAFVPAVGAVAAQAGDIVLERGVRTGVDSGSRVCEVLCLTGPAAADWSHLPSLKPHGDWTCSFAMSRNARCAQLR
jgi:hypothetical protein